MSWSASATDIDPAAIDGIEPPYPVEGEPAEQLAKAKELAALLADSGVVGDPAEHRFNVALSGHANPDHEPAEGYANDTVSVTVSQAAAG